LKQGKRGGNSWEGTERRRKK